MRSCCTCHFSIVYRWFKYLSPDPCLTLTVLIAERCAQKSQDFVDYQTHKTGKMLPHVKYSFQKE